MGEAKRKRQATEAISPAIEGVLEHLSEAMHRVVGAVTDFHGADCLLYAEVGAEALRRLGVDANAVAGTASWRVGPGDGDVISHATSVLHPNALVGVPSGEMKAGMFHAWIEVGTKVLDFTTRQFAHKALQLDEMDGNTTQVDWCPPFLWLERKDLLSHADVASAPGAGVCSYERSRDIENTVLGGVDGDDRKYLANVVLQAMKSLQAGQKLNVIGLGLDDAQNVDSAVEHSTRRGLDSYPIG